MRLVAFKRSFLTFCESAKSPAFKDKWPLQQSCEVIINSCVIAFSVVRRAVSGGCKEEITHASKGCFYGVHRNDIQQFLSAF